MSDLSGIYNFSHQLQHDKHGDLPVLVNGVSWLCLVVTPWAMIAFLADLIGYVDLTATSQIILSITVACALPQFRK